VDEIFDAGAEAMSEEEKQILFSAISSEVDMERGKDDCRGMFKSAIKSRVWRRYLGLKHLRVLESRVSSIGFVMEIPVEHMRFIFISFGHGVRDTELISELADENLLDGAILKTWLQVIWLDMHIAIPDS
jgi:hypothetical protein